MPNSLIKFINREEQTSRGTTHWGRADKDGAPFRGHTVPFYTEDEYEERVIRVADPCNGTFDTTDEEQNKAYMEVLDGIANGWYTMVYIERWRTEDNRLMVYVEWLKFYMEDGTNRIKPALAVTNGEATYGQKRLPNSPG